MKRFFKAVGGLFYLAVILASCSSGARAQVSNPANLNTLLCNGPVGSIAVRYPDRWRCLAPGVAGQIYQSNGPAAVGGWYTPSGTGNVQTDAAATSGQFPFFTNATTLGHASPGGALLDQLLGLTSASPTGYVKRTATGTFAEQAIPLSDIPTMDNAHIPVLVAANIPAFTGSDCNIAAGTLAISCSGMQSTAHTYSSPQTFASILVQPGGSIDMQSDTANLIKNIGPPGGAIGSCNAAKNMPGMCTGASYTKFMAPNGGGVQVTDYAQSAVFAQFGPSGPSFNAPVPVAQGGTGQTTASGTALDAIGGFTATGLMSRTGAGTYSFSTLTALLDAQFSATQGSVLYRGPSGWSALPPGSSGQYLTSQGAGSNPAWQTPTSLPQGSRFLLNTITLSGNSIASDTTSISGTYSTYDIELQNVVPSVNAQCKLTLWRSGAQQTTGYHSSGIGASDYNGGSNGNITSQTTYIPCSDTADNVAAASTRSTTAGVSAQIHIVNPGSGNNVNVRLQFQADAQNGSAAVTNQEGDVGGTLQGPITGFSVSFTTGNLSTGTIKVYGSN